MKLHLAGHLTWYLPQNNSNMDIILDEPVRLVEVLGKLKIPSGEILLMVVNGELAETPDLIITNKDRVDLYPPIGGGSK